MFILHYMRSFVAFYDVLLAFYVEFTFTCIVQMTNLVAFWESFSLTSENLLFFRNWMVRWPTRAIQKYKFQYNNMYSSTKKIHSRTTIYIPVHKYVFQYNNIYSSTQICFSVQQ